MLFELSFYVSLPLAKYSKVKPALMMWESSNFFIMKHEDSGMKIKEEWIMDLVRVSAVLLHVMFMKLYFARAIFLLFYI